MAYVHRLDRNARARLMFRAEALDHRTRYPGDHGGVLKRTGLAVLRALLFHFANVSTGRCDPGIDRLAAVAGVARSTCLAALRRLEAFGLVTRVRRRLRGPWGSRQISNAYLFGRVEPGSGYRPETTNLDSEPMSARSAPARAGRGTGDSPRMTDPTREEARRSLEQAKAVILRRAIEREERERRERLARLRGAPAATVT